MDPWRTPYFVPIMVRKADPLVREIVVLTASQMAKTECQLNIIGQQFADDPQPCIVVFPTENAAQGQFEPRLMDMLNSTPSLRAKTAQGHKNKKTAKLIGGVSLRLAWAGSATELASQPAALLCVDELDRMEPVKGEGDVVQLVKARSTTYPDKKLIVTSTPTVGTVDTYVHEGTGIEHWKVANPEDIESPTWLRWQKGTRCEWAVPCPACNLYFVPRLRRLKWPKGATPAEARVAARLECPACFALLDDGGKDDMNAAGRYVAPGQQVIDGEVVGEIPSNETWSYWVSGLCSPWRTFGEAAQEYVEALASGDPEIIQAVVNTVFNELYSVAGLALPWEEIKQKLTLPYAMGEVPAGAVVLVAGVDIQADRYVYEIRAFGLKIGSWLVECGEVWGDPRLEQTKRELLTVLGADYGGHTVRLANLDSGFWPEVAYDLARRLPHQIRATKGHDSLDRPLKASMVDVTVGGKTVKRGVQLWHVDAGFFKSFVYGRFAWPAGEAGGFYLPHDVPDRYVQELTAEKPIKKASGRTMWVRVKKANHSLDTAALAVAGAYMLQVHKMQDAPPPPPPKPPSGPPPAGSPGADTYQRPSVQPAGGWNIAFRAGR